MLSLLTSMLFLSLLERTPDFAAVAVVNAPAEGMVQFRVIELGQDEPSERRVIVVVKGLGDPADFLERGGQRGRLVSDLERTA